MGKRAVEVIVFNGKKGVNETNIKDQLAVTFSIINLAALHYNILQSLGNKVKNYKIAAIINLVEYF